MLKKKSHTVVCQQKILSPDRGLGKKIFYPNQDGLLPKPNHPYTAPLPHPFPPLQMVRPLLK